MDLEGLRETSLHEAAHALYCFVLGWEVLELQANGWHDGVSRIALPLTLSELPKKFRAHPQQTAAELTGLIGALMAPSIVLNTPVIGGDERDLAAYHFVWDKCRWASDDFGPPWETLRAIAETDVKAWLAEPPWRQRLMAVAEALATHRSLNAEAFQRLASRG